MRAPKKITEKKATMTEEDKASESYAKKVQDGTIEMSAEVADAIIRKHNARPGVVQLITRTQWLETWK